MYLKISKNIEVFYLLMRKAIGGKAPRIPTNSVSPKPKPMEEKKRSHEEEEEDKWELLDAVKLEADFRTVFLMTYCKSASEANEARMNELRYIGMRYYDKVLVSCGNIELSNEQKNISAMIELLELSSMLKKLK